MDGFSCTSVVIYEVFEAERFQPAEWVRLILARYLLVNLTSWPRV